MFQISQKKLLLLIKHIPDFLQSFRNVKSNVGHRILRQLYYRRQQMLYGSCLAASFRQYLTKAQK